MNDTAPISSSLSLSPRGVLTTSTTGQFNTHSGLPWTKLEGIKPVPDCDRPEACRGCPYRGQRVGSRGPEDSPFVLVGESPGSNELYKGYPFVGDSGEMLDAVLEKVGWAEKFGHTEPLVLNAIQCYPYNKDQQTLQVATGACNARLIAEIKKHPRKVILALGSAASQSLLGNYNLKITQERGKVWASPLASNGIVTTVHPAFLMRQGTWYGKWRSDMKYAVDLMKDVDPKAGKWSPPEWAVITERWEYERLVEWMSTAEYIAGDIETGGANSAGLNHQKGYILELVVTSNREDGNFVYVIPGNMLWDNEDLTHQLLGNKAQWIWQNGKFDIKFFRYEGIHEARVDQDTMLLSYCMNENKGHDLDTIAWEWIGAPNHKTVLDEWFASQRIPKKKRDYAKIPTSLRWPYAAYDVSKTYHVFHILHEAVCMDKWSNIEYHRVLLPASEFLTWVEMKGLAVDFERLAQTDAYLQEALIAPAAAIQEYARQYLGHEINIGSYQQLGHLLYDKMKLGAPGSSTDDDHMIKIQRVHDHPIATKVQQWRKLSKARNTYVKNVPLWPGLDGRVHVTFKLHGTSTGRLSSGDPTNLQNWPRDPRIRGTFVAGPGKVLIECDLNQAELRCLALMSADPTLLEIYTRNEVSIHHITSVALFGDSYTDDEKMRAKAVNFGIVYGRTAPSLAEEFDISVKEADEYIRLWFERFPVAQKFIEKCRNAPTDMRNLITVFGRKKRWGLISHDNLRNSQNEAANFPHQSTAHDITLLSGVECRQPVKSIWQGDFVNEIHDALYMEVDDDPSMYGPAISYVTAVMQRVPRDWGLTRVPFLAEAKVGRRWGGLKNAKDTGIKDEAWLSEFMREYKPTEQDHERARELVSNHYATNLSQGKLLVA